jgi:hypothetical protein
MIRVTLRQVRTEAIAGLAALAVLAIVLLVTGPHLAHVNHAFAQACKATGDCGTGSNPVFRVDMQLQGVVPLLVTIAPALLGIFFGAPLIARELETGTFRLAWTQSVTRRRWLAVKLGLVGLASMAIGGLLTWMADWWASPLDAATQDRFNPVRFGWHGVAPIGYAAFAFAVGATAGVLLRRTIPAMGATLAAFIVARLAVEDWVRPNLASPLHRSLSLLSTGFGGLNLSGNPGHTLSLAPPPEFIPNGWVLSTAVLDRSGHALTVERLLRACPAFGQFPPPSPATMQSAHARCVHRLAATFRTVVTYQPGSRFWPFQWAELGIFVAGALALCGVTYWWLQRQYA